jgi:hypothetical protein
LIDFRNMATPGEKLAEALTMLKKLQDKGEVAIHTSELPGPQRALLIKKGFLTEVSRAWYIQGDPAANPGDSTSWYSSYWEFCAKFLEQKYGNEWIISPEQSLLIHAGSWSVPSQLIVRSPKANNTPMPLPFNTSLFNYKVEIITGSVTVINGIRMYTPQAALIYSSPSIYTSNPIDTRTALSMIRDASELLPVLLDNSHSRIAGRLAGAFRNIGREKIANDILGAMKAAGYDSRESDPFEYQMSVTLSPRERSPYVNRIKLLWTSMRETVIANFPDAPGLPSDQNAYMDEIDQIYVTDAYHSLSIERYRVTPELIERVRSGAWDAAEHKADKKQKDAMAARGYWQAFQAVKTSIAAILKGANPGRQVNDEHSGWYRELFNPSIAAGLLRPADLAGYRSSQVYITNSKHTPLNVEAMRDAMPAFFELLEDEPDASVRAVLGHFIFVFIHPYMDGNGRIARFLMNAMLASGGYPWTVIPVGKRQVYMKALEKASVEQDITLFAVFLAELVRAGIAGNPEANLDHAG